MHTDCTPGDGTDVGGGEHAYFPQHLLVREPGTDPFFIFHSLMPQAAPNNYQMAQPPVYGTPRGPTKVPAGPQTAGYILSTNTEHS